MKKKRPCAACGAAKSNSESPFLVERHNCSGEFWICDGCWFQGANDEAWNELITQRIIRRTAIARHRRPFAVSVATGALLALFISACSPPAILRPPENHNAPLPTGTAEDCHAACETGRKLHCLYAEPTPEGGSCEDVCNNTETSGYASMNPGCLKAITACEQEVDCAQ